MKPETINVYSMLASIPQEIAGNITTAKTGGGRALKAVYKSKSLTQIEKCLMAFLGSELNFQGDDFINQYRYISLNTIAENLSLSKQGVINILNGYKRNGEKTLGLIEKGYINKRIATPEEQEKGWSNHYCLTSKIFDEYMITMIENYNEKELSPPSQPGLPPQSTTLTPPSQPGLHKVPSYQSPSLSSLNAAAQPPAVKPPKVKKPSWKPPKKTKMKTWGEKTDDEKLSVIDDLVKDLHREAVEGRKARPFNFDNIPDLMLPVIELYGLENVKIFLEKRKDEKIGLNVRLIKAEIMKWMNEDSKEVMTHLIPPTTESQPEADLGEKIIEQIEVNMVFDKSKEKEYAEILNNLPIEFQEWIRKLPMRNQMLMTKDLKDMNDKNRYAYLKGIIEREKKTNYFNNLNI